MPGHGGGLIAFLQATPFSDGTSRLGMEIAVHPNYRLRGIGSRLYERALDKAQVRRATRISSPVFVLTGDRNAEGCLFLIKRGFLRQSGYWQMRVDNIVRQTPPRWPPGIEVCRFSDVERAPERWAELIRAAFDEPATTEMVAAQTREQGSDPSGYFFARDTASGNPWVLFSFW